MLSGNGAVEVRTHARIRVRVSLPFAESLAVRYCRSLEARAMDFRLRQGTTTPSTARFDHPLLCGEGNLPLLKSFKGAILASKPPGIWRMSVRAL